MKKLPGRRISGWLRGGLPVLLAVLACPGGVLGAERVVLCEEFTSVT